MQKKKANIEQLTAVIKKYKVVGSFFFVSCTSCFWLGTYYEKVIMTREITEIETRHQKEYMEQKENFLKSYYDLKEKILKYGIFEQAKAVTSSLIDMYILKGVESQMINFFDEINEYVGQKYLSPAIFHHVKSYLFDQFYHNKIDERQFKLWMFHVECLGRD